MKKKKQQSKAEIAAKQARYRIRAKEAQRKLRMMQYRCAARVRLLQQAQGVDEELLRDEALYGEHLNDCCPFNDRDPELVNECIEKLRNSSSCTSAENEDTDDEDVEQSLSADGNDLKRNRKLIQENLKRKLEAVGDISPNAETPDFLGEDIDYGNTLEGPTQEELEEMASKKPKLLQNQFDHEQPSTSRAALANDVSNVLNESSDGSIIFDNGSQSSSEGDKSCSEIYDDKLPIHFGPENLDFKENQRSDTESDNNPDCDGEPVAIQEMINMPNNEPEDVFYDAVEEFEEDGNDDPREDNALLLHGTNLSDFKEAIEKESQLPTVKERNHSLYARFFFLASILAVTDRAAKAFWNFARSLTDRTLLSFKAIKKRFEKVIPPVNMTYEFLDTVTKKTHQYQGSSFPRSKFPRPRYILLCEWSTVEMTELHKFFLSVHPNGFKSDFKGKKYVDLFVDGVPLAKSSDALMNVLCARFLPCRKVWPVAIHIYRKGQTTDIVDLCSRTLQECLDNNFIVRKFIGDSPMRAKMKCLKQHNGYCSCEWCYCVGRYLKSERKMAFDSASMNYRRRTHAEWLDIVSKIERNPQGIAEKDRFGIKGSSPLLQLSNFDIIRDFVPDPMHNIGLGVGRALLGLIFEVNNAKEITSAAGKEIAKSFDKLWLATSIPQEFPRAPRAILNNLKHLKASEILAIICCGFTHLYTAMKPFLSASIIKTWLYFCFIVHAALLPDPIFEQIMPESVGFRKQREFYRLYERNFGVKNCTFNLHTFSHLFEIRRIGALSDFSAMPFESYFSYLKKIIKPYTLSFAKQCLIKSFISNMNDHSCGYQVCVKTGGRKRTVNNIICTKDGLFYFVFDTDGDKYYKCNQIFTKKFYTPEAPELDWDEVYVKVMDKVDNEDVLVLKKKVLCKVILADKVLISVPNDVYYT